MRRFEFEVWNLTPLETQVMDDPDFMLSDPEMKNVRLKIRTRDIPPALIKEIYEMINVLDLSWYRESSEWHLDGHCLVIFP